jgi:hypothetical protein
MTTLVIFSIDLVLFPFLSGPSAPSTGASIAVYSTAGLQLVLTVNTTRVPFGGAVQISVDERNLLSRANNVSAADYWPVPGLDLAGPNDGCPMRDDVGIVVFQGPVTSKNVSTVNGEQLSPPGAICIPEETAYSYLFQPLSDNATGAYGCKSGAPNSSGPPVQCKCTPGPCPPLETGHAETQTSFAVSGYYLVRPDFHSFPPGEYTVVAGDEWGALAMTHFMVSDPGCKTLQASLPFPAVQSRLHGALNTPGAWAFTANLSSSVALQGQTITINGSLVNVALGNQTVRLVNPLLAGLQVLQSNGSVAWEYSPPSIVVRQSVAPDENIWDAVNIPTSQLKAGQTYTIIASPGIYDPNMRPLWSDLTITVGGLFVC